MVSKVSKRRLDKMICVVGLGYVGLPLAEAFSRHLRTIGYRRDQQKVDERIKPPVPRSKQQQTQPGSKKRMLSSSPSPSGDQSKGPGPRTSGCSAKAIPADASEKMLSVMKDTLVLSMCTGDD